MDKILHMRSILQKNSLECSDEKIEQLDAYTRLLLEWNKKVNLISRKDEENVFERHILLSLSPLFLFSFAESASILDLGTGGGLPGIPLAIFCPSMRLTLIDSIQKKTLAVTDMVKRLGIANARVVTGRAEELSGTSPLKASFQYVVSRAVSSIADLIRWSRPLLDPSRDHSVYAVATPPAVLPPRSIVLYKGGELAGELREAQLKMKSAHIDVRPLVIHGIDADLAHDKKLVIIQP